MVARRSSPPARYGKLEAKIEFHPSICFTFLLPVRGAVEQHGVSGALACSERGFKPKALGVHAKPRRLQNELRQQAARLQLSVKRVLHEGNH